MVVFFSGLIDMWNVTQIATGLPPYTVLPLDFFSLFFKLIFIVFCFFSLVFGICPICLLVVSFLSLTNRSKALQEHLAQRAHEGHQEKMAEMEEM